MAIFFHQTANDYFTQTHEFGQGSHRMTSFDDHAIYCKNRNTSNTNALCENYCHLQIGYGNHWPNSTYTMRTYRHTIKTAECKKYIIHGFSLDTATKPESMNTFHQSRKTERDARISWSLIIDSFSTSDVFIFSAIEDILSIYLHKKIQPGLILTNSTKFIKKRKRCTFVRRCSSIEYLRITGMWKRVSLHRKNIFFQHTLDGLIYSKSTRMPSNNYLV